LRARDEERLQNRGRGVGLEARLRLADGRRLVDYIGDELALQVQAVLPGLDLALAGPVQDQGSTDQDRQAEEIEEDDEPA
jgi:hypothetical protein